jgi:hypothetical protein
MEITVYVVSKALKSALDIISESIIEYVDNKNTIQTTLYR